MKEYYVSWWNVENLFDRNDATRSDKLKRVIGKELTGWNAEVLGKKLSQLSTVISQINNNHGPDILGICEVESKEVVEKLLDKIQNGRNYKVSHYETHDRRGIDIAFIYDADLFIEEKKFSHYIVKRTATRELFQVTLIIKGSQQQIILIGNHWPARIGGERDSEPYRIIAGETLAYFHQRIVQEKDDRVAVIAMGDFNDEPFSRSIAKHALSMNEPKKVVRARNAKFYNLMWPLLPSGRGTHYYGSYGSILDQMMVSKGFLVKDARLSIKPNSIKIEEIPAMTRRGKPIRFGRPSKKSSYNEDGFSDHFPISAIIQFDSKE